MISTFLVALPRFHENLHLVILSSPLTKVDGKLAHFTVPFSSCDIVADYIHNSTSTPHECVGPLKVTDGQAESVVFMPECQIGMEAGAPEPALWPGAVIGSMYVKGLDTLGRFWVGRSTGVSQGDERSIDVEFATSDKPGLAGLSELASYINK